MLVRNYKYTVDPKSIQLTTVRTKNDVNYSCRYKVNKRGTPLVIEEKQYTKTKVKICNLRSNKHSTAILLAQNIKFR